MDRPGDRHAPLEQPPINERFLHATGEFKEVDVILRRPEGHHRNVGACGVFVEQGGDIVVDDPVVLVALDHLAGDSGDGVLIDPEAEKILRFPPKSSQRVERPDHPGLLKGTPVVVRELVLHVRRKGISAVDREEEAQRVVPLDDSPPDDVITRYIRKVDKIETRALPLELLDDLENRAFHGYPVGLRTKVDEDVEHGWIGTGVGNEYRRST
jgi:hypothetical protein